VTGYAYSKSATTPTAPTIAKVGPTFSPPVRLLLAMNAVEGFTGKGMTLRPAIENAAALHRVSALELSLLLAQKQQACAVARTALAAPAPASEGKDDDAAAPAQGEEKGL